jgi:hypothetical protein
MFTSLRGSKVFLVSLILCIPLSAIIHLLVFGLVKIHPSTSLVSPSRDILFVLATGAFVGLFKSLIVSAVTYLFKPSLRGRLIVGSIVALSLLEAWIYYELWTWTFPFG